MIPASHRPAAVVRPWATFAGCGLRRGVVHHVPVVGAIAGAATPVLIASQRHRAADSPMPPMLARRAPLHADPLRAHLSHGLPPLADEMPRDPATDAEERGLQQPQEHHHGNARSDHFIAHPFLSFPARRGLSQPYRWSGSTRGAPGLSACARDDSQDRGRRAARTRDNGGSRLVLRSALRLAGDHGLSS